MIRDVRGNAIYWNKWFDFLAAQTAMKWKLLSQASISPLYDAQHSFQLAIQIHELMLVSYSRGDSIEKLTPHFVGVLDAWELSNLQATDICRKYDLANCRAWTFELINLSHYNWCICLVSLALTLDVSDSHWSRLIALVGSPGEDVLLDRLIATRQPTRIIGTKLLHYRPYARLNRVFDAPMSVRPILLRDFVDNWYAELARSGNGAPWWHIYGDPSDHPLEMGHYFGRWCLEAAAVSKAFCICDSHCLGHEHYPGDLLRPEGPSTHARQEKPHFRLFLRFLGACHRSLRLHHEQL